MDIYYFDSSRTPHLAALARELCLVDGLPFTLDEDFRYDADINKFFLHLVVPQSPSPNTWGTYAEQLSFFFRFLQSREKTWRDADEDDFKAYYRLRRVKEGDLKISSRSWNVFAAAARRLYEWAVRHKHIGHVPFDYKEIEGESPEPYGATTTTSIHEKQRGKDIKYMTEQDFQERFLPEATNTREGMRNALFVRLLMRSGLRAEEAVKLKLRMLPDPDNPTYAGRKTCPLTITGKGVKERTVRVPKSWLRDAQRYIQWDRADAVEKWKKKNPGRKTSEQGDRGFLFLTSVGTPVGYSAMYKMMRTAGNKSGFDFNAHPHMLRHSYAIYQLSAMIRQLIEPEKKRNSPTKEAYRRMVQDPLRKLQRLMGHASITSTFIYLDYIDDESDMVDVTADRETFGPEDGYEDLRGRDEES